jgi:hypothetical protein
MKRKSGFDRALFGPIKIKSDGSDVYFIGLAALGLAQSFHFYNRITRSFSRLREKVARRSRVG